MPHAQRCTVIVYQQSMECELRQAEESLRQLTQIESVIATASTISIMRTVDFTEARGPRSITMLVLRLTKLMIYRSTRKRRRLIFLLMRRPQFFVASRENCGTLVNQSCQE